jgi:hypothetical protein
MKRVVVFSLTILVAAAALARTGAPAAPAAAQAAPRDQRDANLTWLADREAFLMVWTEDRGAGSRIYAKLVNANGIPVGGADGGAWAAVRPAPGGPTVPGDQRWPAIIPGLIVYSEKVAGGTDYDLYAQRLFDNGRPTGAPMLIQGGPGDQRYADVVPMARGANGGEFLIVWSEDTRDAGDVMGIRVDYALRRSRGPAFPIAQGPGTAEDPVIAQDLVDEDSYLVLFTDNRNGNRDIYGTRVAQTGLPRGGPLGGQFPVVQSPQDDYAPELLNSRQDMAVGATATPRGGATPDPRARRSSQSERNLLIWTTDDVTNGPDMYGQRLAQNGKPLGPSFLIAGGPGAQSWPAAALRRVSDPQREEREEWLAVWQDDRSGTFDILGARVGVNGIVRQTQRMLAGD